MNEKHPLVTTETQVDRPPRLRVDTAGLSEETRRELGLVEFEAAEQIPPIGRAGGTTIHRGTAGGRALREGDQTVNTKDASKATPAQAEAGAILPANAFPEEKQRAGSEARLEEGNHPNGLEHHPAPARETNEEGRRQNEEAQFGRSQEFDTSPAVRKQSVESQVPEEEGRQRAQGGEEINGEVSPGAEQGSEVQELKPGEKSRGEEYNPTLANDSTVLRPGQARSGEGATGPRDETTMAHELPAVERRRSATGRREESDRLAELHAAVKQNIAHSQQTHAAVLQTLRDSARLHTAQRAELGRLAAQVKMLLGQSENAGFNRQ